VSALAGGAGRGRLAGKVAIITGAGSGIGRASTRAFVAEGARVLAGDIRAEQAQETCAGLGAAAVPFAADVSDPHDTLALVQAAVKQFGRLDVLYSNAGVPEAVKPLERISALEWDRIMAVNLKAFFLLAQAAVPVMRATGGGTLIVTASIAARRPRPGMAAYVASKSGVIGLARALAIELASEQIRVNVINPGPARTPMLKQFGLTADGEQASEVVGSALPLGRAIEPEDVAAAAVYLASDEASAVTGLVLNVDGGRDL
jgi:3-oxoacyl-[acyl-carrier protein] reductase